MTFYFSSFFIHVIQAVPHTKYRRAQKNELLTLPKTYCGFLQYKILVVFPIPTVTLRVG